MIPCRAKFTSGIQRTHRRKSISIITLASKVLGLVLDYANITCLTPENLSKIGCQMRFTITQNDPKSSWIIFIQGHFHVTSNAPSNRLKLDKVFE